MSDSSTDTTSTPPAAAGPVKLPPLKLPPKPVASGLSGPASGPALSEPAATGSSGPVGLPGVASPGASSLPQKLPPLPRPPVAPAPLAASPAFAPLNPPGIAPGIPKPHMPAVPVATGAVPLAPAAVPVKPEAVAQPVPARPLPQATIKLQAAPAPVAIRKPLESQASHAADKKDTATLKEETSIPVVTSDEEKEEVASDIPLPLVIATAVLALIAVLVQVWTLLS